MKTLLELSNEEAKVHFLKGSSYFNADIPKYISFEPILRDVDTVLNGKCYLNSKSNDPSGIPDVNYSLLSNKDGKFTWRPLELIHPAIYISLVNKICDSENWTTIQNRFSEFKTTIVDCCSIPVISDENQTDKATQVKSWWGKIEQQSLSYSLEYSHILHTDITNCYGSLYTHSISWAIHGLDESKAKRKCKSLLGNKIDSYIRAGRYGQTNGISQGSVLMDFIAEIVLGYVDTKIHSALKDEPKDFHILRYRDDYRIFANSDHRVEEILKVISDQLRLIGMGLGASKTFLSRNVIEGSIKPDKLAAIDLQDLGTANARTIQKQLLRLHSFGQRFPNSGALKRLLSDFYEDIFTELKVEDRPKDIEVLVAIATDIGFVSPSTFPAVAAILSKLIELAEIEQKLGLWNKVRKKMSHVPYNGYLEILLQRVIQAQSINIPFSSKEAICKIVNQENAQLWNNSWIENKELKIALEETKIVSGSVSEADEVIHPDEIKLFKENTLQY